MNNEKKIDIAQFIIDEINNKQFGYLKKEKLFIQMNKTLCNKVLYTDSKYKESTIIITHMLNNLMADFIKEVNNCINKEGAYKDE